MRGDDERLARRVTFDRVADLYARHRAVAPPEVFDDLLRLARLERGAHVLEIGCGTGQATLPLAQRALAVTAVELGAELAERARSNLAPFPSVRIVTASFEDWDPAGERFDAVVSFNAFHWLDEGLRFAKSAAILREGRCLCVFGSRLAVHEDGDPVWLATADDYLTVTGEPENRPPLREARDRSAEFELGGHFHRPARRLYRWDTTYDADGYVGLLRTISSYAQLDEPVREELFRRIHRRISAAPTGTVVTTTAAVLYVAERAFPRS